MNCPANVSVTPIAAIFLTQPTYQYATDEFVASAASVLGTVMVALLIAKRWFK